MKYRTKQGDVLDLICHRHYGADAYDLAAVLEANRGLADRGPILPAGVIIDLPDLATPAKTTIRLWD